MAARLFWPPAGHAVDGSAPEQRLPPEAHRYLARVLRLRVGDTLVVFDGEGREWDATIVRSQDEETWIQLSNGRQTAARGTTLTLLQALPKADRMEFVVQKATELGVDQIVPVLTSRVVVRLDPDKAAARQQRWQKIAQEAARQCGRADVPRVHAPRTLADALGNLPPGKRLAAWEDAHGQPLLACVNPNDEHLQILIGPEGGLSRDEIARAEALGFVPVTLGPRILRTETAALVALTLAKAGTGGLDESHEARRARALTNA